MREFRRCWTAGRVRKSLTVRLWWGGNPLCGLRRLLRGRPYHDDRVEAECSAAPGQDWCYCGTGRTTTFRLTVFGVGLWGWLSRDWTARPCGCDKIVWLLFPDSHEDEVAEYGLERLRAEFPGVGPLD